MFEDKLKRIIIFCIIFIFVNCTAWADNDSKVNVLFITFDTTRADHIGCYGYKKIKTKNIDNLANEGCLFEKAFSPVPLTFPAHVTMFTGRYPITHGVKNNGTYALSDSANTLPEILKKQGYKTAAFISAYILDRRFGLDQGFDVYDDDLTTNIEPKLVQKERRADTVTNAAIKWLERGGKDKFFLWVHYFDPHDAYQPPPPFSKEYAENPYDGEIAYADYWLGKLLGKLSELGIKDNTLIILAGDHGEGLGDHNERTHGIFLYEYAIWIPLIISYPKTLPKSKRISSLVRLIDLSPTILDMLSIKIPEDMQGVSLLPLMTGKKKSLDLVLYCETEYTKSSHNWSPLEGIRTKGWKYIFAPIKELYNLEKDTGEKKNLFKKEKKMAEKMENLFAEVKKKITPEETPSTTLAMDEQTREKLKSLGYVWTPESKKEKDKYPDPKEMIKILEIIDKGAEYFAKSEFEKAAPLFKKAIELNPEDTEAYITLGHIYEALGDNEKSLEAFIQAVKLEPEDLRTTIQLGVTYMNAEKYKEGLDVFSRALELNPRCKEAYFNIGLYHFINQDWVKARENFENVLKLDTDDAMAHNYMSIIYQRLGDYTKAISEAEGVLIKDPNNSLAMLNLGSIYQAMHKTNEAQEILERAVKTKPDFSKAHYFLGLVYFTQNETNKAIQEFKLAIQYDPKSVEAHYNLGYIYLNQNNIEQAIKEFRESLDINPDFIPAKQMLQKIQPMIND